MAYIKIRDIDEELEKEVHRFETFLLVSFANENDTLRAVKEISRKYECIVFHTEEKDGCNVIIPATVNGKQLFEYEYACEYGEDLCRRYNATGFLTQFQDVDWGTGKLEKWIRFFYFDGEKVIPD